MQSQRQLFEVCLYNQRVRDQLDMLESNTTGFSDCWAERSFLVVIAADGEAARKQVERDYPPGQGFVIVFVAPLMEPVDHL